MKKGNYFKNKPSANNSVVVRRDSMVKLWWEGAGRDPRTGSKLFTIGAAEEGVVKLRALLVLVATLAGAMLLLCSTGSTALRWWLVSRCRCRCLFHVYAIFLFVATTGGTGTGEWPLTNNSGRCIERCCAIADCGKRRPSVVGYASSRDSSCVPSRPKVASFFSLAEFGAVNLRRLRDKSSTTKLGGAALISSRIFTRRFFFYQLCPRLEWTRVRCAPRSSESRRHTEWHWRVPTRIAIIVVGENRLAEKRA